MPTHAVSVFRSVAMAAASGVPMVPRSANDKEYFAQDWFAARLDEAGLAYQEQGRNSYPDFLVRRGDLVEGYEIKSLAFSRGRPARKDIDFNSTIPSGLKDGLQVFLAFFLYTGTGASNRPVHTVSVAHSDLVNADHAVADLHVNMKIPDFGSYGDGFIRNRKMYVFPHPVTIDEKGIGRVRLIVPEGWGLEDPSLCRVGTIDRTIAADAIHTYTIAMDGSDPAINRGPYDNAGIHRRFSVFEYSG